MKLVSSPAKVEEIATTSHDIDDDTTFDLPYDSDDMLDVTPTTSTTCSSCTSCAGLKNKVKSLQKTLSWYKKTKANLQNKIRKLEAERNTLVTPAPRTAELEEEYCDDESQDEHFDSASSMDYASLEESSQSAEEMEEEDMKNTIRYCKIVIL